MALNYHQDVLDDASVKEVDGVPVEATRVTLITPATAASSGGSQAQADIDNRVFDGTAGAALRILQAVQMQGVTTPEVQGSGLQLTPGAASVEERAYAPGARFLLGIPASGTNNNTENTQIMSRLICTSRRVTMIDAGTARLTQGYEYVNRELNVTNHGIPLLMRPRIGLKQVTTDRAPGGLDIEVQHQSQTQVAEVSAMQSETAFECDVLVQINNSHDLTSKTLDIARDWVNHINRTLWYGFASNTVICRRVSFRHLRPSPAMSSGDPYQQRYLLIYTFEFASDPTGYQPRATWKESGTGRAAPNMLAGQGNTTVAWHPEKEFHDEPSKLYT